jgi:hypothetical protein
MTVTAKCEDDDVPNVKTSLVGGDDIDSFSAFTPLITRSRW